MPNEQNQAVALSALNLTFGGGWTNDQAAWTVVWVRQGRATFDPGINLAPLKPNDVLVVPAGNKVAFKIPPGAGLDGFALAFFPAHLPCSVAVGTRVLLQNASQGKHVPTVLPDGNRLVPLLSALERPPSPREAVGRPDWVIHACPCPLVSRLNSIIEELLRAVKGSQGSNGDISLRVMAILGALQQQELQSLTVDELARRCGCSRRHLARLVREQCGGSLSAIVNRVRLEKAAELLLDPNRKIVDVAPDCGFNHLGSFSKRFRERFGLTPAAWRRQKLGLQDADSVQSESAPAQPTGNAKPEPATSKAKQSHPRRRGAGGSKPKTSKSNAAWTVRKVHASDRSKLELNKRPRRKRR